MLKSKEILERQTCWKCREGMLGHVPQSGTCDRGRPAINILDHTTDNYNYIGRPQLVVTLLKSANIAQGRFMSESHKKKKF